MVVVVVMEVVQMVVGMNALKGGGGGTERIGWRSDASFLPSLNEEGRPCSKLAPMFSLKN